MKVLNFYIGLLFFSSSIYAQCIQESTSPFSGVKWKSETPTVRVDKQWIFPLMFDETSVDEIISFCKKNYQTKWKKRFSEDFVEVLCEMNSAPNKAMEVQWKVGGSLKTATVSLSKKNRKKALAFNDENPLQTEAESPTSLTKEQAIADVIQFRKLLRVHSSYLQIGDQNLEEDVEKFLKELEAMETIQTSVLARELGIILGRVGDRHSSIRSDRLTSDSKKFLPFAVAPWMGNKTVALQKNEGEYALLYEEYPVLIAINKLPIAKILEMADYEELRAPEVARHMRRVFKISDIQFVFSQNDLTLTDTAEFTFSDVKGEKTKSIRLSLSQEKYSWKDIGSCSDNYSQYLKSQEYEKLFKVLGNTGYIALPRMANPDSDPKFFELIKSKMDEMKNTNALVLDIRDNGGGRRDLLRLLAPYFMSPKSKPWVANLTKIRVDTSLTKDFDGASSRGLFVYDSPEFSDGDREAIDQFMNSFTSKVSFDEKQFSDFFYLILNAGVSDETYYYDKPVYVLMDEGSFSAASVFATALKGLNNVKIAGVRSDGSSGMSKIFTLDNSWTRLRLSRMISLQRNGLTLDGYGTAPDILLERDLDQILSKKDTQLQSLLEIIESEK